MRTTLLTGLGVIALAGLAGAATAQTPPPGPAPTAAHSGPQADRPHHRRGEARRAGPVTRAEFVDQHIARLTALDADRDGVVSVAVRIQLGEARIRVPGAPSSRPPARRAARPAVVANGRVAATDLVAARTAPIARPVR